MRSSHTVRPHKQLMPSSEQPHGESPHLLGQSPRSDLTSAHPRDYQCPCCFGIPNITVIAITMSSSGIFPFFSLARELRDLIYSHCLKKSTSIELSNEIRFHVHEYPYPHLFRVNRQFGKELREVAEEHASLHIYSTAIPGGPKPKLLAVIPGGLRMIRNISFELNCWNGHDIVSDLTAQDEWITTIIHDLDPDKSKDLSYHINLMSRSKIPDGEAAILWSGIWIDMHNLKELLIMQAGEVLSRWDGGTNQFVRVAREGYEGGGGGGENVSLSCGPGALLWQGEVAYLFQ